MVYDKFDAILFGNGMTLNLFYQLREYIKAEKQYLLDIDSFLKYLIEDKLTHREEQCVFKVFYRKNSHENNKNFSVIKDELRKYYQEGNANIEKIMGRALFGEVNYNGGLIRTIFPILYNIWFDIVYQYIVHIGLEEYMKNFYTSIKQLVSKEALIYTTNFDYLADNYLEVKHIHGSFIKGVSNINEAILGAKNDKEFYFKYIWGWNGLGKLSVMEEIKYISNSDKYFNFDFFYKDVEIDNLLIYGMGFQQAGYISESFLEEYPQYRNNLSIGTVVDEHILIRIKGLQNLGKLNNVTISYHWEEEKEYFEMLFNTYEIQNVQYINTSEFAFNAK